MGHIPVLLNEIINALAPQNGETFLDCTFNRAGHSVVIAEKIGETGTVVGIDLDHVALAEGKRHVESIPHAPRVIAIETNFRFAERTLREHGIDHVDMLLADLGLSSQEIDISGRGFTFQKDEPLVMTLSTRDQELTAYTIVNEWSAESLTTILQGFSDERYAWHIANAIVEARMQTPILTTRALREVIWYAVPVVYRHGKIDPATKTFQAIRMAVNDEVGALHDLLASCENIIRVGGRLAFITFHSVEDRIVKHFFQSKKDMWQPVTKKPIAPSEEEVKANPRARSAKLRVYTRLV